MAEEIRLWLLSSGLIPVNKKDFNIDFLDYKKSMSLQMENGNIINAYIGGEKEIQQPFRLYYRSMYADNEKRNSIMDKLNSIGDWVNSQSVMPGLGEKVKVCKIECSSTASILLSDEKSITYQINFNMNYEIKE